MKGKSLGVRMKSAEGAAAAGWAPSEFGRYIQQNDNANSAAAGSHGGGDDSPNSKRSAGLKTTGKPAEHIIIVAPSSSSPHLVYRRTQNLAGGAHGAGAEAGSPSYPSASASASFQPQAGLSPAPAPFWEATKSNGHATAAARPRVRQQTRVVCRRWEE